MFHIAFLLKTRQSETQPPQANFTHVFLEKRKTRKGCPSGGILVYYTK